MKYYSTRGAAPVSSAEAIVKGLATDGGLYTMRPEHIPRIDLRVLKGLSYTDIAAEIISRYLADFSREELKDLVGASYKAKFSSESIVPLRNSGKNLFLELYHGPTSAFKDIALCVLPRLMKRAAEKTGNDSDILILTATSGDTGKAALEGFKDVPGIRIIVFYPNEGVSAVQKAQMVSQKGENIKVCAIEGNFDDAQSGVKTIFEESPAGLSSANSINIGRLVPQIVYYFSAYIDACSSGIISEGELLNYAVPTGNFGDILAGYLAKEMGLPVGKLICASNRNNILTDFIASGSYDMRRPFYKTLSPSMDILLSSNLERLLFLLGEDSALIAEQMNMLRENGVYTVPPDILNKLRESFLAYHCDDSETKQAIAELWQEQQYLCDPHTAVAYRAAKAYNGMAGRTVILSTASPYKFPGAVLSALGAADTEDEFEMMESLYRISGCPIPENLKTLKNAEILHRDCISPQAMRDYVFQRAKEEKWKE